MTKKEILKLTGLTEKEFYKLYPTKEAYEMKFGGILSNTKMQDGGNPIVYPQQPTEDQFFNYGASYNVGIPYMEYGGPYPQQGTADEFFNFGKPAPSLNFYQTGGNVEDEIIQIIEKFAEINNIAPQNIIDELKNMGQGEQQEAIQQMLEYVQANSEQEVSQDLYGQGLTQEEYPENSSEDYAEDMMEEPQSMKMGGKKLKKYQGYNSIVNENNKKDQSYLNKTSDFANWLRNTALQSDMDETMGKMQKGGPFERTYKGRTYIVDPTTKTVIDKATGTDATKMAGLEFPDLYQEIFGQYAESPSQHQVDINLKTSNSWPNSTIDSERGFKNAIKYFNESYPSDKKLKTPVNIDIALPWMDQGMVGYTNLPGSQTYSDAVGDTRKLMLMNRNKIKDDFYQGIRKYLYGGDPYTDEGTSYIEYDEASGLPKAQSGIVYNTDNLVKELVKKDIDNWRWNKPVNNNIQSINTKSEKEKVVESRKSNSKPKNSSNNTGNNNTQNTNTQNTNTGNTTTNTTTATNTTTGTTTATNTGTNTGTTTTSSNKGYRVYEGDNTQPTTNRTRSTQTVYNPNVTYSNGYDSYGYGYQPSYGYGYQAPYGYGYTTLGNPFLGLIGSLLSGPFGGNWGFDMIPFDYYGDNRNARYINASDLRGQRRPGNQKSYLEDMQRRMDRGEGIDSDEVEIYTKLKNRFQDQKDRKENKLLRKDTRFENRNKRAIDRLVNQDNMDYYFTEDQVPDEQWDPNVNKTSKEKYEDFLQYAKDRNVKLNKKNFEDVWGDWYQNRAFGGSLKKKDKFDLSNQDLNTLEEKARHKSRAFMTNPDQKALSLDVNGKPERFKDLFRAQSGVAFNLADYYDPNEMYDLPEEEYYNYPMENSNMLNPDPNSPIGNMPGVWETGSSPRGIQSTWKDIKGNNLFEKSQAPKTAPEFDKRRGLLLRQRTPRPEDVLNTINLATATLNQRNQKLRERQLRTRLDDPRNLFTEGYTKERGAWYPGPGLQYGTQDPYGLDLSGPARGYFKKGGKMAIGGPIAKDYLYLTNSMIDALSNLGGQVGYID